MGIAAMKKAALIKVPIKLERVKRPKLFPLLISKPWLILSVVAKRLDTLLFASSMLAQLHSILCIFGDPDVLHIDLVGPATPPTSAEPLLLIPQDQESTSVCLACVLSFDSPLTPSISENMSTVIS